MKAHNLTLEKKEILIARSASNPVKTCTIEEENMNFCVINNAFLVTMKDFQ